MATLLEQIQQEALDPDNSLSDLLRKVKLAAAKLGVEDATRWVDNELNGYDMEPPEYRTCTGEPRYFDNFHGWFPVLLSDREMQESLQTRKIGIPVSEIEALLDGKGELQMPFPPAVVATLQEWSGRSIRTGALFFPRAVFARILDSVRNRVLDWTVELEKAGVRGEGKLSFSKHDREVASTITFNMFGGSLTGNVGHVSGGSTVHATSTQITAETLHGIRSLATQITEHAANMGLDLDARERIVTAASALREETARPQPIPSKMQQLLTSIRTIAEGAAGNLIASGVLHEAAKVAHMLGG
jgi:hypothetical protein